MINCLLFVNSDSHSLVSEQNTSDPNRKETLLYVNHPEFSRELESFSSSVEEVKIQSFTPDLTLLQKIFTFMNPSGKIVICDISDASRSQSIILDLQICGFVDVKIINHPTVSDTLDIIGQRPSWNLGEAAPVSIKKSGSQPSSSSWKINTNDLAEDDLVDENELLNDNIQIPVPIACGDDEATNGKKRACKNCTCGLAEQEMQGAVAGSSASLSDDQKVTKASSCGSCYKGDAFRCGSCPFLGKPAFEPGMERVVLSLGDDI